MQVIFIHHSCFLVEVDDKVLIFDYFAGDRVNGYRFTGRIPTYAPETELYLFASHSHADHYDLDNLRLADRYPSLRFIFSKDIRISPHFLEKHGIDPKVRERVLFVQPDKTYELAVSVDLRSDVRSGDFGLDQRIVRSGDFGQDQRIVRSGDFEQDQRIVRSGDFGQDQRIVRSGDLELEKGSTQPDRSGMMKLQTLRSTDAGVAFYVELAGVTLFHAGDLGDWSMDHAGELINGKERREYRHQIRKLAGRPINLAFVPVDPRLGSHQWDGLDFFLRTTDAEYVFPMHMWQDYSGIAEYKKRLSNRDYAQRVMEIERENQVFVFGETSECVAGV